MSFIAPNEKQSGAALERMVRRGRRLHRGTAKCVDQPIAFKMKMNRVRLYVYNVKHHDSLRSVHVVGAESNINVRTASVPSAVHDGPELALKEYPVLKGLVRLKTKVTGLSVYEIGCFPRAEKYFFAGSAIVS